ncbi:MAG: hypothetical protein M1491_06360 [Deltaproteobacteria bacterium]|nr:hypothetical protein [Deltaproteobacteria bacterium]MCL5277315.1 hypothetical protein [Deltaproteobacteria bacterium]
METNMGTNQRKERIKLTPEQLYNMYIECNAPGAPVKLILQRNGLTPWDLASIRKKVRAAALDVLSKSGKPGKKQQVVPVEQGEEKGREGVSP